MPTKCSVAGCENYYSKRVPFFDIPSPLKYKFCSQKAKLSERRRKLWLDAIGYTSTSSEILRICSKHFVSGKPAPLEKTRDVDWVPTLHIKLNSHSYKNHKKESERSSSSKRESSGSFSKESCKRESSRSSSSSKSPQSDRIVSRSIRRNHKKVDVKRYRDCKVLLNGNLHYITYRGTNGSGLTLAQKYGKFTSCNVTVKETAVNNTILRVHLLKEDLKELKRNYKSYIPNRRKRKRQNSSGFGRQIKPKSHFFEDSRTVTPLRRGIESNKADNTKSPNTGEISTEKSVRQMRSRNEKENKSTGIISKFQLPARNVSEKSILQKTIQKSYRDRIKIKLFPKAVTPTRKVTRKEVLKLTPNKPLTARKEVFIQNEPQWTTRYYLKFSSPRYPEDGMLRYSFQKLVTDVKHMKLPAPSWKIKVIIKQGKIAAITFTNKSSLERCIGFFANSDKYKITIDNRPALLLGSPEQIRTSEDLEILLDIIQNIDSDSPMIFYK